MVIGTTVISLPNEVHDLVRLLQKDMLKSGQLRETLTLQQVSYTKDDNHERVATWSDVCNVKASVVPRATSEVTVSERPEVQQLVDIVIRYRKALTVKNRFKHVQDGSTRILRGSGCHEPTSQKQGARYRRRLEG